LGSRRRTDSIKPTKEKERRAKILKTALHLEVKPILHETNYTTFNGFDLLKIIVFYKNKYF